MGLQKFEKDFREKLLNRELKPSTESWEKLEAKLETGRARKTHRYWWIGIAASIAGAVFMLNQFYFNSAMPVSPEIVETPVEAEKTEEVPGAREIPVVEETLVAEKETEPPAETPANKAQKKPAVQTSKEAIAVVEKQQEELQESGFGKKPATVEEELIAAKLGEVLAAVSEKEQAGSVTDEEVDELLNKAATELQHQRTSGTKMAAIDHESLLWEVEMELERSFREKVLDILREGYMKTRTAVANRSF